MASKELEQSALFVWNPRTNPETISSHVSDFLTRKQDKHGRFTWWGRIITSDNPSTANTLDPIKAVHELFAREQRERAIFVTDYQSLHVLWVDRAVLPEEPGFPAAPPTYYSDRRVGLYLRVRDIRVLSHDRLKTLDFLATELKPAPESAYGVDPYASMKQLNPRLVWGPPLATIFNEADRRGARYFAELDETSEPDPIRLARRRLVEMLGHAPWGRLCEYTQSVLAYAHALYIDPTLSVAHNEDADGAPIILAIANVVEYELARGCLQPLYETRDAGQYGLPKFREVLMGKAARSRYTLGSLAQILGDGHLRPWAEQCGRPNGFAEIVLDASGLWQRRLGSLRNLRNAAAHAGHAERADVVDLANDVFAQRSSDEEVEHFLSALGRARRDVVDWHNRVLPPQRRR